MPLPAPDASAPPLFAGEFRHALDAKNRLTVPARWRTEGKEEDFFVIKNPLNACLTVMPPPVFRRLSDEAYARAEPARRQGFLRRLFSQAQQVKTDRQGRFVLTEEHCKAAGLRGDVLLTGVVDRFEIWSEAEWRKFSDAEEDNYKEVSRQIGL